MPRKRPHLGHLERDAILLAQLLQLSDDAVCDAGRALRIQAVHHARHQVNLCIACTEGLAVRAAAASRCTLFRRPQNSSRCCFGQCKSSAT